MEVRGIPREQIETFWPFLEQVITMSIIRGTPVAEETPEDVKQELLSGDLSCWIAIEDGELQAAMTAYIADLPQLRRAVIKHLAGANMENWIEFYPQIEEWAKSYGATQVIVKGRAGWAKVLQQFDFKPQYVALAKNI